MNVNQINIEPVAVGIYSLGVYYVLSLFWPVNGGGAGSRGYWIFFWTGFWKHISVIFLGLQDYFGHFYFVRTSRTLTETEIGRNPGGKEFRESVGFMVLGAFVEGCVFLGVGYGLVWMVGLKKGWNVFWTGILVYFLAERLGIRRCGIMSDFWATK
jgi:hypothetical protein